jgi:hypothetical protein
MTNPWEDSFQMTTNKQLKGTNLERVTWEFCKQVIYKGISLQDELKGNLGFHTK